MKVVLDTNVLVSAFLFEKRLGKIIKLIEQGSIIPCFIVYTFDEFKKVLNYEKFDKVFLEAETSADEIFRDVHGSSLIFDDPKIIPDILPRNNPDNYILATAQLANAEFIITGDKLLLSLKNFENIPIITPQRFLERIKP